MSAPITRTRPRRALAGATAALVGAAVALVSPAAPAGAAAEAVIPESGMVAEYLFTQATGATVANTATGGSVGAATVVNGTDAQWTGDSLVFAGGAKTSTTANYVRLPDNILATANSATITIETKFDATMASAWHFLWNIGSNATTSYYFASLKDLARTAITASGGGGEVNARTSGTLTADRWYSVTSVIDGDAGTISFYIDGIRVAQTATTLKPSSITPQTMNTIGRAPYPDPMYKGEVSTFRVYDRALTATEVADISEVDAQLHADEIGQSAQAVVDGLSPVTVTDTVTTLPSTDTNPITWTSNTPGVTIADDGRTLHADLPEPGADPLTGTLTASASVRGITASRTIPLTVEPAAAQDDPYGYLMVHFIEDSAGYAEKIYLDVSRGDNPEQWDPLNGGEPILASHLGTTGVRDPYLTYNPETGTYYIIATDLRVFGGDSGSGSCTSWCYWTTQGSTKLNVWESTDLVTWSAPRQFDVALNEAGQEAAELGMAWAPEATWVDDYYPDGRGAFILYWSSNIYDNPEHTGSSYSRVLWGATTDFTQDTYAYGGPFVDTGGNTIDTTMIQHDGTTYRITKDNSAGKGIYMESTTATRWWEPATTWTERQTRIGAAWAGGNAGGVEGPAVFKSHDEDRWYLYVDVIPTVGYKPMTTTDLDSGWAQLTDPSFYMAPHTKHGGVVSLTKARYDTVRAADVTSAVTPDLGTVTLAEGADADDLTAALPATTLVNLAYDRGTATQPVNWDTTAVDLATPGTYEVTGTVRTIGANLNAWVGAGGSTDYDAPDRELYSATAITVTADVVVAGSGAALSGELTVSARCIANKVTVVATARNTSDVAADVAVATPYGTRSFAGVAPGAAVSAAFATRALEIGDGTATATLSATVGGQPVTATVDADIEAFSCVGEILTNDFAVSTRCIGGKVTVTATLRNTSDLTFASSVIETAYGTRTVAGLAPDRATSVVFATRAVAIDESTATATLSATIDGQPATLILDETIGARSCA